MNTTLPASLLKVAECQKVKFSSVTEDVTLGSSGLLISISTPWPMQAPAAIPLAGKAVMSWQPLVALSGRPFGKAWLGAVRPPGKPPSGNSTGSATTAAEAGAVSGTATMLILSCGVLQLASESLGLYEET